MLKSPALAQAYTNKINSLLSGSEPLKAIGVSLRQDVFTFPTDHQELQQNSESKRRLVQLPHTVTTPFNVSVYFSPGTKGFDALLDQVDHASKSTDLAIRWVTNPTFIARLIATAKRGVPVRLLTNRDMLNDGTNDYINDLLQGGVALYSSKKGMNMHWKATVVDLRWVWTGSANATIRAQNIDEEDILCADSPELAQCYESAYKEIATRMEPVSTIH